MNTTNIVNLSRGDRVRFIGSDHPKKGRRGVVIAVLPNPSKRQQSQWYDVRFDDYSVGRFLERQLVRVDADDKENAA